MLAPLHQAGFLTNETRRTGLVVLNTNDRVGQCDRDGREDTEVKGSDNVEQLVLREDIDQLVVHEYLFAFMLVSMLI